jgi:NOL1/NOP2/fmu family ribosome biogenesis protein
MNFLKIYSDNEKEEIEKKLAERFGIKKIDGQIIKKGTERLFLYQGSLDEKKIKELERARINIERIGIYFAKLVRDEIRLSIDGVRLFKNQITKNILELNEEQANQWMLGQEILLPENKLDKGFAIMKYKDYLLGCGKISADKIGNFVPKNRRLKQPQ